MKKCTVWCATAFIVHASLLRHHDGPITWDDSTLCIYTGCDHRDNQSGLQTNLRFASGNVAVELRPYSYMTFKSLDSIGVTQVLSRCLSFWFRSVEATIFLSIPEDTWRRFRRARRPHTYRYNWSWLRCMVVHGVYGLCKAIVARENARLRFVARKCDIATHWSR